VTDRDAIAALFREHFPSALSTWGFDIVDVGPDGAEIALDTRDEHLRPGGIVSGPTLMALADTAMYAALLARNGEAAITGVTTSLEIHFLRRAIPGRLAIRCRLLEVGQRLAVGTVELTGGDGALCGHATVTYAL
jgi:uncharacterized protein (TIGR00369 family)